jgi:hypothetical protein
VVYNTETWEEMMMNLCQSIECELDHVLHACRTSMRRLLNLHVQVRSLVHHMHGMDAGGALSEEVVNDDLKLYLKAMQDEIDRLAEQDCIISNVADGVVRIHTVFQNEALCFYWDAERDAIAHWRFAKEDIALKKTFSEQALLDHFALVEA